MTARWPLTVGLMLALVGCAANQDDDVERVTVGDIELAPPSGWTAREFGPAMREWAPADNPGRETLTVIVGPRFLGGAERAFAATRTAQGLLRDGRILGSGPVTTKSGLEGMQFDLRFRPDSAGGSVYQRSHVVLVAGDHTVHVLYTAATADADPSRTALARLLATIQQGG